MDRDISLDAIKLVACIFVCTLHTIGCLCLSLQIFIYPIFYFICRGLQFHCFLW